MGADIHEHFQTDSLILNEKPVLTSVAYTTCVNFFYISNLLHISNISQ